MEDPSVTSGGHPGAGALEDDVVAFAALAARVAAAGSSRDEVLAAHGMTEERWEALERRWQERLDQATDAQGDADGAPPLVVAYAEAFSRAQRSGGAPVLPFDAYLDVARALQQERDAAGALQRRGVSLGAYLSAHEHWTKAMLEDAELASRFERALVRR